MSDGVDQSKTSGSRSLAENHRRNGPENRIVRKKNASTKNEQSHGNREIRTAWDQQIGDSRTEQRNARVPSALASSIRVPAVEQHSDDSQQSQQCNEQRCARGRQA